MKLQKGLSLIELLIAIAIIGFIMGSVVLMMQYKEPGSERKKFAARLNDLMHVAWEQAVITHAVHRVLFDFQQRKAWVEKDITQSPLEKNATFVPLKISTAEMSWPTTWVIRQFIVEGFDEMQRFSGRKAESSWFYVIPDGMAQQVTINGVDKAEIINGKPSLFGLVLNPYMAQFRVYDAYQK